MPYTPSSSPDPQDNIAEFALRDVLAVLWGEMACASDLAEPARLVAHLKALHTRFEPPIEPERMRAELLAQFPFLQNLPFPVLQPLSFSKFLHGHPREVAAFREAVLPALAVYWEADGPMEKESETSAKDELLASALTYLALPNGREEFEAFLERALLMEEHVASHEASGEAIPLEESPEAMRALEAFDAFEITMMKERRTALSAQWTRYLADQDLAEARLRVAPCPNAPGLCQPKVMPAEMEALGSNQREAIGLYSIIKQLRMPVHPYDVRDVGPAEDCRLGVRMSPPMAPMLLRLLQALEQAGLGEQVEAQDGNPLQDRGDGHVTLVLRLDEESAEKLSGYARYLQRTNVSERPRDGKFR